MKAGRIGAAAIALLCVGAACVAKPAFKSTFYTTYNIKDGSTIAKAKCGLCHIPKTIKLNPYGLDLKKALEAANSKVMTPNILKSVEALDSDNDGFTNIQEITADTLPGDAQSHPAKADDAK
jgi:hypothetical protein